VADQTGQVTFSGERYVKSEGRHSYTIEPSVVRTLADELLDAGFLDFTQEQVDDCQEEWTDDSSVVLTLEYGDTKHATNHYLGCTGGPIHELLTHLEDRVDEALQTKQWIGE